ncbi:hypothetical protein GGR56DRAFT_644842 [Xylariaceae sp. FL0804]|nr:hypothetical protein GGR56DRAFT_644842 [Xylariaceae sp. FL0804]
MDAYAVATNSPPRPRYTLDDGPMHRRNGSRFDSHDDFYEFLDNNRTSANAAAPLQPPPPQSAHSAHSLPRMPPAQQPGPSRPPVTNAFPERSRPPSYSGSRSEELLVDKNATPARNTRQTQNQNQNGRRPQKLTTGPRPQTRAGSPPSPWSGPSSPNNPPQSARPATSGGDASLDSPSAAAAAIQRLKSPSIQQCVLQPLEQKVHEYEALMQREQEQMARLDDEIRALQERRADAEMRFMEAKGKHDDYRRQHQDVDRALRGEAPLPPTPMEPPVREQQQHQHAMRPMSMQHDDEDDEDDEDLMPSYNRRVQSQQSFSRSSQKPRARDRFRFSLFGDR